MSIQSDRELRDLRRLYDALEERVLKLEMQKRPVEPQAVWVHSNPDKPVAGFPAPGADAKPARNTITLRGKQ